LSDQTGVNSVQWNDRDLLDSTGTVKSIDWDLRQLLDSGGAVSCNYSSRETYDSGGTVRSINWNSRGLYNGLNALVAGWGSSNAFYLSGTTENSQAGAMWYSTAQKAIQERAASITQTLQGVIFTQTATGTAANTASETTISSTGVGTLTLPTDFFVVGKTLRIRGKGFHSSTASPTLNLKVKFGSTVINATGTHTHHNATNGYFDFECDITCRTTGAGGTVFSQGIFTDATDHVSMGNTATISVNTTTTQAITVTAQWSVASASNTISMTNLTVEVLN
jgi:hypothetical protein